MASYVSTLSMSTALRSNLIKAQAGLSDAHKEMVTGRHADIGLSLGTRTGQTVNLRNQYDKIDSIITTNGIVAGRMDVTQKSLDGMLETAQEFLGALIGVRDGANGAEVLASQAQNNLQSLIGALNASMGGQFIFAGIDSQNRPVTDFFAPGAANKQAIDDAFADFVVAGGYGDVGEIPPADMTAFLEGAFAAEFGPASAGPPPVAGWDNWSTASDQNVSARISTTEIAQVGTNANKQHFRELAMGYTMIFNLAPDGLNSTTYRAVIDEAIDKVSAAITGLVNDKAQLGTTEERIKSSTDRLSIQRDVMGKQIDNYEGVDEYEASARVTQLQTQVDTALALTARLQQLSILNWIR